MEAAGGQFTKERHVTPRNLMSHTSGTGDGFGFPGYAPGRRCRSSRRSSTASPPSNLGPVRLERAAADRVQVLGRRGVDQQLALMDAVGKPFAEIAREWVLIRSA